MARTAVKLPEQEQKEKAKKQTAKVQEKVAQEADVEIDGNVAFTDKDSALATQGAAHLHRPKWLNQRPR